MSVIKKGRLLYTEPGSKKKPQSFQCELWDNKVIDLTGINKYASVAKSINLVRCKQIEPDNYTSTKFSILIVGGYSHELQAVSEVERTNWIDKICDLCGICNPLTANIPSKQKRTLPPLPPPKPISEEKRIEEDKRIYEDISDDDEYIAPTSVHAQEPEGGVLEYHYPNLDRRIRPASYLDDHGGAPVTSSSGGGMFDEDDDDEYIDPTIPAASMRQLIQAPASGPGYMNTNTLDGKDLTSRGYMNTNTLDGKDIRPKKNFPKSSTLPHRSPSMKERSPASYIAAQKPLTPPSSRKKIPGQPPSFDTRGTNNELLDKLKKRKNIVEEVEDDSVFEPTRPSPPAVHSKRAYQITGLDKPLTVPPKATSTKPPSRSMGSKPRSSSSLDDPSASPDWKVKQPQIPEQDPPWRKQMRESKPSLPVEDPPWFEQKKSSKDRFDKPYPLPTESAKNDRRFDKPYPPPTETAPAVSSERRFDKPYPLPTETTQPPRSRGKLREREADSPPPPLPGRTSSKRDMFESEKSVSPADRKPPSVSRKPVAPPTSRKPPREAYDDFDFPTADQFKAKTNRFSQPAPIPQRNSTSYEFSWNKSSIDNKPPPTPPKPPYR